LAISGKTMLTSEGSSLAFSAGAFNGRIETTTQEVHANVPAEGKIFSLPMSILSHGVGQVYFTPSLYSDVKHAIQIIFRKTGDISFYFNDSYRAAHFTTKIVPQSDDVVITVNAPLLWNATRAIKAESVDVLVTDRQIVLMWDKGTCVLPTTAKDIFDADAWFSSILESETHHFMCKSTEALEAVRSVMSIATAQREVIASVIFDPEGVATIFVKIGANEGASKFQATGTSKEPLTINASLIHLLESLQLLGDTDVELLLGGTDKIRVLVVKSQATRYALPLVNTGR